MQEFFTIIGNFGFPIAVASYLLFRFEKKLEALETTNQAKVKVIDDLTIEVRELKDKVVELEKVIVGLRKRK